MESTVYHPKQLLWFIVLHLGVDVHSCFAVFMSSKVLDGLWINTSIEKIGDVGMPLRYNKDKRKNPVFSRVSAFVVAYSIPFPTLIANEKSVE